MTDELHQQDFAVRLHTRFEVLDPYTGSDRVICELELVEVSEEKRTVRQEIFSIVLTGPEQCFLPQRIYRVRHEGLGQQEIFLVPVGRDADGYHYQAVFNRLLQPAA